MSLRQRQQTLLLVKDCATLSAEFLKLQSVRSLATLLEIEYADLKYFLYKIPDDKKYTEIKIPKKLRKEEFRKIQIPMNSLEIIQRKLSQILYSVYRPYPCVHGYAVTRSIITNAEAHCRKRIVLNIDIESFFESINFGRVRGLFISKPYNINPDIATVLAQICCFQNKLPQGAPSSPVISNMICAKMDAELQRLASKNHVFYTRYVDDMTFSSNKKIMPTDFVESYNSVGRNIVLSNQLISIIEGNGFRINTRKTRLALPSQKQVVTGLVVNQRVNVDRKYIRNIRAMLHAWGKHGLEKTIEVYKSKYAKKSPLPGMEYPSFTESLYGKIQFLGQVRGKNDPIFQKLLKRFHDLNNSLQENSLDL